MIGIFFYNVAALWSKQRPAGALRQQARGQFNNEVSVVNRRGHFKHMNIMNKWDYPGRAGIGRGCVKNCAVLLQ
jgi:hypothetical protein